MPEVKKMICPKCGTQMNHHANKPDRSADMTEPSAVDPELGGILEIHTCPNCRHTEAHRAS